MNGRFAYGIAGGGNLAFGIIGLVFTALLIAATIVAIVMLIDAARARGVEVKGGRLAGFWIVGLILTPIVLALYVLCIKPEAELAPVRASDASQHPARFGAFAPSVSTSGASVSSASAFDAVAPQVAPQKPVYGASASEPREPQADSLVSETVIVPAPAEETREVEVHSTTVVESVPVAENANA